LSPPWLLIEETFKIVNKIEKGEKGGKQVDKIQKGQAKQIGNWKRIKLGMARKKR
jgi:hypothetical protein